MAHRGPEGSEVEVAHHEQDEQSAVAGEREVAEPALEREEPQEGIAHDDRDPLSHLSAHRLGRRLLGSGSELVGPHAGETHPRDKEAEDVDDDREGRREDLHEKATHAGAADLHG